MDADDLMPTDKLKILKRLLQEHGTSWWLPVRSATFPTANWGWLPPLRTVAEQPDGQRQALRRDLQGMYPSFSCWMAYRETLLICGAFERCLS